MERAHETPGIRPPAVAGLFYPAGRAELAATVDALLTEARPAPRDARPPKAIVAPHAGYVYSGPIAASAYALLAPAAERITRVVIVGPAHRVWLTGLASPGASAMRTPLGEVAVDVAALDAAGAPAHPAAHAREHSLEVQLPFLQRLLPRAHVIPLVVGAARAAEVGTVLEALWGGDETAIVVSSDLSHYLPYAVARAVDAETAARVVALDDTLAGEQACGAAGINGLTWAARRRGMRAAVVDLRSSGDTAGGREEVVGYGAFAFYEG